MINRYFSRSAYEKMCNSVYNKIYPIMDVELITVGV